MQIFLPTSPNQITLEKFVAFKTADSDIDRCIAASGKSRKQVMGLKPETIRLIIHEFAEASDKTSGELKRHLSIRSGLRSMRLSIIPNLEAMTLGEHVDMDELSTAIWKKNQWARLPQLMGILYRPILEKFGEWYKIEKYDSNVTKHSPFILKMTMDEVNAALLFFSTIGNELEKDLAASLVRQAKKVTEDLRKL